MFKLTGKRPQGLGVKNGQLKPAPNSPNCVSSQAPAEDSTHHIEPFTYEGDTATAMTRLKNVVANYPGAQLIESKPDYVYAEFSTGFFGFVDDVEFFAPATGGILHVRSASRLGTADFGTNRRRIETLRSAFAVSAK